MFLPDIVYYVSLHLHRFSLVLLAKSKNYLIRVIGDAKLTLGVGASVLAL